MNWDALGAIGELVSAVGVIGTLAYLALQIRGNTKESRLNAAADISRDYSAYLQHITADAELSKLWWIAVDGDYTSLTEAEQARVTMAMGNIIRILESAHVQYSSGRMDEKSWMGYDRLLARGVNASMFPIYWGLRKGMHNEEFGALIEEHLKNPDQASMFLSREGDT